MKSNAFALPALLSSLAFTLAACGGGDDNSTASAGAGNGSENGTTTTSQPSSGATTGQASGGLATGANTGGGEGAGLTTSQGGGGSGMASQASGGGSGSTGAGVATGNGVASSGGADGSGTGMAGQGGGQASGSSNPVVAALSCGNPIVAAASDAPSPLSAETPPAADGTRLYPLGSAFQIQYTVGARGASDTLLWSVQDQLGANLAQGQVGVPADAATVTLSCSSTLAGYMAAQATLAQAGGQVARRGSGPAGLTAFGVLPDVSAALRAVAFATQDQHRFGYQGFNDAGNYLGKLGASWQIEDRQMSATEPNSRNQFNPSTYPTDPFDTTGQANRLIRLDGLSSFVSKTGTQGDTSQAPADLAYYQNYMSRVGANTESIRAQYFPTAANNYYQVTWEPSWTDTDANFVAMYQAAHQGLHSTDSKAIVMGSADPFPSLTTARLKRLAPLGLPAAVDGIATHGYYDAGTSPSHPPERLYTDSDPANAANALPNEVRDLRAEMAADYKPGIPLFFTETGISYDLGLTYDNYPAAQLYAQGAVVARTHVIILGEGGDKTFFFYGSDYPDEVGYGTFFDLDHAQGQFGATNLAPKPAAMAIAAMTQILDGTTTLGFLKSLPAGDYAYSFQRLKGGPAITAAWMHNNAAWDASVGFDAKASKPLTLSVDAPGASGTVTILDSMGNASPKAYSNGQVVLSLTELPQYVVYANADVARANATTPQGYAAPN